LEIPSISSERVAIVHCPNSQTSFCILLLIVRVRRLAFQVPQRLYGVQ